MITPVGLSAVVIAGAGFFIYSSIYNISAGNHLDLFMRYSKRCVNT